MASRMRFQQAAALQRRALGLSPSDTLQSALTVTTQVVPPRRTDCMGAWAVEDPAPHEQQPSMLPPGSPPFLPSVGRGASSSPLAPPTPPPPSTLPTALTRPHTVSTGTESTTLGASVVSASGKPYSSISPPRVRRAGYTELLTPYGFTTFAPAAAKQRPSSLLTSWDELLKTSGKPDSRAVIGQARMPHKEARSAGSSPRAGQLRKSCNAQDVWATLCCQQQQQLLKQQPQVSDHFPLWRETSAARPFSDLSSRGMSYSTFDSSWNRPPSIAAGHRPLS